MKNIYLLFICYSLICCNAFAQSELESFLGDNDKIITKRVVISQYKVVKVYDDSLKEIRATGFFVSSEGHILTALHAVVNLGKKIKVVFYDFKTQERIILPAVYLDQDDTNDVALLQIAKKDVPYFSLYTGNIEILGFDVISVGYPFGPYSVNKGILSSISFMPIFKYVKPDSIICYKDRLLLDLTTNEESSGSPVLFPQNAFVLGMIIGKFDPLSESKGMSIGNRSVLTSATRLGVAVQMKNILPLLIRNKISQ